jgi:transcriptional regulator with XRE-family HTH domain
MEKFFSFSCLYYLYLTILDKSKTRKMIIGQKLRELREKRGLLLRQVAAELEVDTAYISKMERGEKNIKRDYILKLAEIYKVKKEELLTLWLADQVYEIVKDEEVASKAIQVTEERIKQNPQKKKKNNARRITE